MGGRERVLAAVAALLFLTGLGVLAVWYGMGIGNGPAVPEPAQAREAESAPGEMPDFSLLPVREEERSTLHHSPGKAATLDEPLHAVDHGGIERSGGRIAFEVVDARGQPLDWRPYRDASVRVTRFVGGHELAFGGEIDSSHDRIVAAGIGGAGLEPGRYQVELSVGAYGHWEREFSILGSETLEDQLRASTYERVVSLHFVDPEGKSLASLDALPQYETTPSDPLSSLAPGPTSVLRDPPQEFEFTESFEVGTGGRSGAFTRMRSSRYPTDEGRVHLRVVAGHRGKITFQSPRLFAENDLSIEDDFAGSQWDDYVVVLHPQGPLPREDGRREERDPGRRSLLERSARPSRFHEADGEPDPFDRSEQNDPNRTRWVLSNADSLEPQVFRRRDRSPRFRSPSTSAAWSPLPLTAGRGKWFTDLDRRGEYRFTLSDGMLWFGEPEELALPPGDFLHLEVPLPTPVELRFHVPETLAAYARRATLTPSQVVREEGLPMPSLRSLVRSDATTLTARTFLDGPLRKTWTENGASLLLTLGWQDSSGTAFDPSGNASGSGEGTRSFPFLLGAEQMAELSSRRSIDLELRDRVSSPFLILRAVDSHGAGLPWVEASLVPFEEDRLAEELRAISRELAAKGLREELELGWVAEANARTVQWPSVNDLEGVVAFLGEERRQAFPSPELLTRIYELGAWYDTRAKTMSDPYGYLFLDDGRLVEGRTFVLYLWSRSRDDLEPDARIVFRAEHAITDLGALVLPSP